jgi:CRP-like cAMP-binding protein
MRPSSLKQSLALLGCSMNAEDTKGRAIVVNLTEGNVLCMEAESTGIAGEWVKVLGETMDILNTKNAAGKTRRINVANEHSDPSDNVVRQVVAKSDATKSVIVEALSQHFLMNSIRDTMPVVDALQPQQALPGDVIIWQGTPGELFYVLEAGHVEVVKDHKQVGQIAEGRAFGELALLNSTTRAATIRALAVCNLWTLDRKTFRNVLANEEVQKKARIVGLLRQVKLFETLSDVTLSTVADVIQRVDYAPGERIIKQGEVLLLLLLLNCTSLLLLLETILCPMLTYILSCYIYIHIYTIYI